VRCINPTTSNDAHTFARSKVLSQLAAGGIVEGVRAMRQTYPHKIPHATFVQQFLPFNVRRQWMFTKVEMQKSFLFEYLHSSKWLEAPKRRDVLLGENLVLLKDHSLLAFERDSQRIRALASTTLTAAWKALIARRNFIAQKQ
jgi:myosin heavy subunit